MFDMLLHAEDAGWYVLAFALPVIVAAGLVIRREQRR